MKRPRPYTIALTGGPCAGKTMLLAQLERMGELAGRTLLFVPEAATLLVQRGLVIGEDVVHFQTEVMRLQMQLEDTARHEAAGLDGPSAIICDRGMLDGAGYCTPGEFSAIATGFGWDRPSLAARYDLVLHLVSAAVEAPQAYTLANNGARIETLEEAIAQEARTLCAWEDHPNRVVVGSNQGFDAKIEHAFRVLSEALA